MSFATVVGDRQLAYITKILAIFGVVEERQMRELFSYLPAAKYGRIMTRLSSEGLVYRTSDAKYLSTSRYSLEKYNQMESVMCFWAFIRIKNRILDFCAAERPTLLTISTKTKEYDLIPVSSMNIALINEEADELPEQSVRFLVTRDLTLLNNIERRIQNDIALLVDENGVIGAYEL